MKHPRVIDVEVIAARACPHVGDAVAAVERAARGLDLGGARVEVRTLFLDDVHDARAWGVSGSPTVRVNGKDVDATSSRPSLACREHMDEDGEVVPWVPAFMIRDALARARAPDFAFESPEGGEILPWSE